MGGPQPPSTVSLTSSTAHSLSNGSKCAKKHGEGLCFECGYVGSGSSNKEEESANVIKPFDPKYGEFSEADDSTDDSDSSDGYSSFHQNRKSISSGKRSHAELVSALTKKKSLASTNIPRKQSVTSKSQIPANQLNKDVGEYAAG